MKLCTILVLMVLGLGCESEARQRAKAEEVHERCQYWGKFHGMTRVEINQRAGGICLGWLDGKPYRIHTSWYGQIEQLDITYD